MYMEFHLLRFSAQVQIIRNIILSSSANKAVDRNVRNILACQDYVFIIIMTLTYHTCLLFCQLYFSAYSNKTLDYANLALRSSLIILSVIWIKMTNINWNTTFWTRSGSNIVAR